MTDPVPPWVYIPEMRAPGTDDEPWPVTPARRRRDWSRIATVLCVVFMVGIAFAAGYGSNR